MKTQKTLLALALLITSLSFGQTDTNALHMTGNESFTGLKSATNSGSTQINGISLTNNGTSSSATSLRVSNTSGGYGVNISNSGQGGINISNTNGVGLTINSSGGAGLDISNSGSAGLNIGNSGGKGLNVTNVSTGNGIVSNTTTAGTGFNYVGQNDGTNTFTVSKTGVTTASSFVVTSGTSSQFLKANGSIDSSIYLTGTGASSYLPKFTGTSTLGNSLIFDDGTKIGIGTTSPQSKLQVAGSITLPLPGTSEISEEGISFAPNHRFNYDGKFINHYGFGFYPYSKSVDVGGVNTYMSGFYGLDFFTADTNRMRILYNGNVGIGTAIPDARLTVNGTIHATEVKVTQTVPADYVFQKYYTGKSELKSDYVMPTLAEIEIFTKKNNHLPDVPSAQEIQQNGVSLGEMSNVLLQKVEELTLYIIKQNKDIEALKAQVTSLMAKKQ